MAELKKPSALRKKTGNRLPEPVYHFFETWVHDTSFITLHYLYFITTCLIASLIFWGSSTPSRTISYTDSLFLVVSAMSLAGLNTVNLSQINTFQQIILFFLIMMGSAIFVSCAVIYVRKKAFDHRFETLVEEKERRLRRPRTFFFQRARTASDLQLTDVPTSDTVQARKAPSESEDSGRTEVTHNLHEQSGFDVVSGRVKAILPPLDTMVVPQKRVGIPESEPGSPTGLLKSNTVTSNDRGVRFDDQQMYRARFIAEDPTSPVTGVKRSNTHTKLFSGVGARGLDNHPKDDQPIPLTPYPSNTPSTSRASEHHQNTEAMAAVNRYLKSSKGYAGRNSQFHNLTPKERKTLGGIEYDAIRLLSWVVPLYFILWQLFGALGLGAWITVNRPSTALENGLNPFWTGAFFAISAFGNSGMALLDANASAFQTSYYVLLTMGLLILAGNTCFPPFLRLILWTMKKSIPKTWESREEWRRRQTMLTFILEHPRRVYTNLFPSAQNWWLVFSLVVLNGIDWAAFEILNIGNPVTNAIPAHFRALDGIFQALAVRCGGFYVVNIAGLRSGLLVLYVLMMYVSALPVTMTIRNTNVYEERSLAIYSEDLPSYEEKNMDPPTPSNVIGNLKRRLTIRSGSDDKGQKTWERKDFLRQQLRGQLGHDVWFVALAVLFITMIETGQFERDPVVFSTFNIIFETVSAYGTVGLSTGVPWNSYSFCGAWHTGSKLILMAVMLRGRHRGLPVAIDSAVVLPNSALAWAEERDGLKRSLSRRRTNMDLNNANYDV